MHIHQTTEHGCKRSILMFDSLTDLCDHNLKTDYRTEDMQTRNGGREFYGVDNMKEADKLARQGLPREGIQAINLAARKLEDLRGELIYPQYEEYHDTAGAFVDMGRYLEGTPECMTNFTLAENDGHGNIVCIILNITYNSGISREAITKNGQALVALVEAAEAAGKQIEIWVDMYVSGSHRNRARTAIKLKQAGRIFDTSELMYALTHPSMLRAHIFNAMHTHPAFFRDACGIYPGGCYGNVITNATDMDDFPPYSVYVPCITSDRAAGQYVDRVLKQIGLLAA